MPPSQTMVPTNRFGNPALFGDGPKWLGNWLLNYGLLEGYIYISIYYVYMYILHAIYIYIYIMCICIFYIIYIYTFNRDSGMIMDFECDYNSDSYGTSIFHKPRTHSRTFFPI